MKKRIAASKTEKALAEALSKLLVDKNSKHHHP